MPAASVLIQHSDRGSQYTADDYLALLKANDIQVSMSSKGDPYDNAMMEGFFPLHVLTGCSIGAVRVY